ncbi:Ribosome quality control complex subunit NEMF [Linum perenne]
MAFGIISHSCYLDSQIILFQFGLGVNAHYVILELYAQGNILLTDPDFTVLTLLRSHRDDDKGISIMSRHRYPTEISRVFERTTTKKLQDALAGLDKPEETDVVGVDGGEAEVSDKPKKEKQMYDEFCPILLNQFKTREHVKFDTFDAALDEFYSKIESQRSEQQQKAKEDSAVQKLTKIRTDQEERKSGNPVAALIDQLHLERNCMILLLSNNLDEMDDDEKTLPADKVEVDIALSAHANARRWYEMKKKQESKQEKTVKAHEKAFKAAERKTRMQLSQEKAVATISHMRKVHWFEKFNWFISSENYLIISGRDAQQNEMIVKRYMSKADLYIHADLHGASSTVIKNHRPEQAVPPLTINQAGCFTVCHSQAWDSKIVTSAWVRGEEDGINDITESGPTEEISDSESDQEATSIKEGSELEPIASSKPASNPTGNGAASVTPQLEDLFDRALGIGATTSGRKYGIETLQVSVDEEIGQEEEKKETVKSKRYISKAERKKLKKAQKYGYSDLDSSEESEEEEEENTGKSVDQPTKKVPNSKPANVKLSRGQKSKLKKMKEKYADQDEEERRIRMALLAVSSAILSPQYELCICHVFTFEIWIIFSFCINKVCL